MDLIKIIYKPPYCTPLQAIDLFRKKYPKYKSAVLGYAGRLDPLAEGLLLILINEENKLRKKYELLPKIYTCDALFGFTTDTYDYMGIINKQIQESKKNILPMILEIVPTLIGRQEQKYPIFSSARFEGKPLYYWARQNRIDIPIPKKKIEIYDINLLKSDFIKLSMFSQFAIDGISQVIGNFRQDSIIQQWKKHLQNDQSLFTVKLKIQCSSGTYVRGIVHDLGSKIGTGAIAYNIKRTHIGEFSDANAFPIV